MNSSTSLMFSQSGTPVTVPNGLVATSSITLVYLVVGAPASMVITVEGIVNASGDVEVLDFP